MSHHYYQEKAAIRQATKDAHDRLRRTYGEGSEKISHKLEGLQLSRKGKVSVRRQRRVHHPNLKYWLYKIGRALDTIRQQCGMWEETVEYAHLVDPSMFTNCVFNSLLPHTAFMTDST